MILADVEASYTPIYPSRLATSPSCVVSCAAYPAHGRSNSQEDEYRMPYSERPPQGLPST